MKISINALCPCHSGQKYKKCCQAYHVGANPSNALALMRSRYSAFALRLVDYIIASTHPDNTEYTKDTKEWKKGIAEFCDNANFTGLEIIEFVDGENEAFVTFKAILGDMQFIEKSRFLRVDSKWLYESGDFAT
ncbi:MAG: YchJ family metal-binding protein [Sulfurovaceae bacterium]|nr:YchJ family metal-binding protein [Sulfurovaceae bacterium]